jgi:hypothetical protein
MSSEGFRMRGASKRISVPVKYKSVFGDGPKEFLFFFS